MLAIPKLIQIRRYQGSSCKYKDEALELIAFHKEATGFLVRGLAWQFQLQGYHIGAALLGNKRSIVADRQWFPKIIRKTLPKK